MLACMLAAEADWAVCLQNIKKGNYDVVAANHTLILGWNSQGISLLRQIAINKLERPNGSYDG